MICEDRPPRLSPADFKDEAIGEMLVCEPNISDHAAFTLSTLDEVLARADVVVLLVDHKEFRSLRPEDMGDKVVIDTRGVIR